MKAWFYLVAVLGILGGGGWWLADRLGKDSNASSGLAENETVQVELGTIENTVESGGEVRPQVSSAVRSEISGRIGRIFVEDGGQ